MPKTILLRRAVVVLAIMLFVGVSALAQDKGDSGLNFGFTANAHASLQDVGLQLYPKARAHKEKDDDSSAANLGMWGNTFGFKLVMLKYESDDSPAKVADFYRKELSKFGKVIICADEAAAKADQTGGLSCKDDHPEPGSFILKSGTKEKQHLVGIKPDGSHSVFQLIYLESKDSKAHFD